MPNVELPEVTDFNQNICLLSISNKYLEKKDECNVV